MWLCFDIVTFGGGWSMYTLNLALGGMVTLHFYGVSIKSFKIAQTIDFSFTLSVVHFFTINEHAELKNKSY